MTSFAVPVVLIIVGIFFLLSNMGIISWHNFGLWFSHYWPVLLIVWGIIKLIEYQQANREGQRARGIGAGGVMLVVMVVIAGLIASEVVKWQPGGICGDPDINGLSRCGSRIHNTSG